MDCNQYREELSARMDGEPLGVPPAALDAHVDGCRACASWVRAAEQVTRLARLAPAASLTDRTAQIVAAAVPVTRPRRSVVELLARLALAAVALAQAALAYPDLVLGHDSLQAPVHVAHETGAWNVALGVAFLWVALRPRNAAALLPLLAAFVALLLTVSLSDLASERVHAARLGTHVLTIGGLAMLAVLAWRRAGARRPYLGGNGVGGGRDDEGTAEDPVHAHAAPQEWGGDRQVSRRAPRGTAA